MNKSDSGNYVFKNVKLIIQQESLKVAGLNPVELILTLDQIRLKPNIISAALNKSIQARLVGRAASVFADLGSAGLTVTFELPRPLKTFSCWFLAHRCVTFFLSEWRQRSRGHRGCCLQEPSPAWSSSCCSSSSSAAFAATAGGQLENHRRRAALTHDPLTPDPHCVLSSRRSLEVQESEVDICPSGLIRVVRHGHTWDRVRRRDETFVWSTGEAGGNIRATRKPRNRRDPGG